MRCQAPRATRGTGLHVAQSIFWGLFVICQAAAAPSAGPGSRSEGRVFRFNDGNRPHAHTGRNMLSTSVDITGSALEVSTGVHSCGHRFVAMGTVQVCDRSPNAALRLLTTFRSPSDGKSIFERVSSHPGVIFPTNHVSGFLDASVIHPTWSGSNWTYYAEFLDAREARKFVAYLEDHVVHHLVHTLGLSCSAAQPPEGTLPIQRLEDPTYDVRVHAHICGVAAEEAATELVRHILQTYPSTVFPRTAAQLLASLHPQAAPVCEQDDECCCESPTELEFVASFLSASDAEAFDLYLVENGGHAVRPPSADCDFCAAINDIYWYKPREKHRVAADILVCTEDSLESFIARVRGELSPMGMQERIMDYIKFHHPSVLSPLSSFELINEDNFMPLPNPTCGDGTEAYCCDRPWLWRLVGLFTDEEDAARFTHYVTSDLTAHLTASAGTQRQFLYPLRKDLRSWARHCPAHSEPDTAGLWPRRDDRLIGGVLEEEPIDGEGGAAQEAAPPGAGNSSDMPFLLFESQKRKHGLSSGAGLSEDSPQLRRAFTWGVADVSSSRR